MPEDSKTQAEEIVLRFKTTRPRGLLLATSLENSSDRLQIYLADGNAKAQIRINKTEKVSHQTKKIYIFLSKKRKSRTKILDIGNFVTILAKIFFKNIFCSLGLKKKNIFHIRINFLLYKKGRFAKNSVDYKNILTSIFYIDTFFYFFFLLKISFLEMYFFFSMNVFNGI